MPIYSYRCERCDLSKEVLWKSLPSEAKQKASVCEDCGGKMPRQYDSFEVVGGTNFEVQKAANFAMEKVDQGGRKVPVYKDANGRVHEVRNSKDLDRWQNKDNQLGTPRMIKWYNPLTGETTMVPQRTIMHADPTTGEPMDKGSVVRESVKLIPLSKQFTIPTVDKQTGQRIDPRRGVTVKPETRNLRHSKHCMCVACCMMEKDDGGTYKGGVDSGAFLPRG